MLQSIKNNYTAFIILGLAIILFHKIFYSVFAYTDSYDFLINADHPNFFYRWVQSGRILFGLSSQWIFTTLSIEDLKWVRMFSFIGTLFFLLSLNNVLRQYFSRFTALFITVIVLVSPSITVLTIWTSTFQVTWALFFGLQAGILATSLFVKKFNVLSLVLIIAFAFISLNLYQPGFTAFILPLFLGFIFSKLSTKSLIKLFGFQLGLFLMYYISFKLSILAYGINPESRSGLNLNIFDSLWWLKQPISRSTWINFIFAPRWIQTVLSLLSIVILVLIIYTKMEKDWVKGLIFSTFMGTFFCLSILPNFLVVDHYVSYRMLTVMSVLVSILIGYAIDKWIVMNHIKKSVMSILITIVVIQGFYNINFAFIGIQSTEYQLAKDFIINLDEHTENITVVTPDFQLLRNQGIVKRTVTDEFGSLSNSRYWVPESFFKILVDKYQPDLKVKFVESDELYQPIANEVVFDFGQQWRLKEEN